MDALFPCALPRWREGPAALHPSLPRRLPSSAGHLQGTGRLCNGQSWSEASGKSSGPHTLYFILTVSVKKQINGFFVPIKRHGTVVKVNSADSSLRQQQRLTSKYPFRTEFHAYYALGMVRQRRCHVCTNYFKEDWWGDL